jgi:hypothetical protein
MRANIAAISMLITCTAHSQELTVEDMFDRIFAAGEWDFPYDIEVTTTFYDQLSPGNRIFDRIETWRFQHRDGMRRSHWTRTKSRSNEPPYDGDAHTLYRDGISKRLWTVEDKSKRATIADPPLHVPPSALVTILARGADLVAAREISNAENSRVTWLEDGTVELRVEAESRYRFIVDPQKNYLVLHAKYAYGKDTRTNWYDTLESIEAAPGVWIPTRFEFTHPFQTWYNDTTVTIHSINEPIDDAVFTLDFPDGIDVIDANNPVWASDVYSPDLEELLQEKKLREQTRADKEHAEKESEKTRTLQIAIVVILFAVTAAILITRIRSRKK